jgi:type I restriction enzyme S subunit
MLFIYLYFKLFEKKISQMGSGSTFAAITIEDVKNLVILLPPLKEQKRIVKIIETKIKTIENIQISIAEQEVLSDKLLFSFIQKLITNRDWKNFKFGDICIFTGGSQPPKSMFIHRSQKDYIRLVQIQDFRKDDAVVYIPKEEAKRTFKKDNVMIGRYGPPVFQILRGLEGAYNVALMKAEPIDENIIDNDFLFYLLQEKNLQNAVINQSQRSAGQSGVDKKFLEKQKVRIPDIKTQRTIVTKIEEYKQKTIKLQKHIKEQSLYINTLPQTILQQAFNGEL